MLQDMRHAGGILWRGAEPDIKYLVVVVIGNQGHPGAGLFVPAQDRHTVDIRNLPFLNDLVVCQFFYFHFNASPLMLSVSL